jgi:hypothetical protein
MVRLSSLCPAVVSVFVACAAAPPPSADPTPPPASASAPVASAAPATKPAPAVDPDDDPDESSAPIVMTPEITRPWDKASFPHKTGDEEKCWQTIGVTGVAAKDFESLITSCGAPLGLREYVAPAHGHLHSVKDKRDTFQMKLLKGLCYRYFAVGDSGIKDIDILVEKPGAILVGDDKQTGPVAIIDAGKPWCMTEDAEYLFNIEVDGDGAGKYVFGAWARPK